MNQKDEFDEKEVHALVVFVGKSHDYMIFFVKVTI